MRLSKLIHDLNAVDGSGRSAIANVSLNFVMDSTQAYVLNPDSLAKVMTYNGPGGAVDTVTAGPDPDGLSFRQTYTYTGSNLTGISAWVLQ